MPKIAEKKWFFDEGDGWSLPKNHRFKAFLRPPGGILAELVV